MIGGKMKNKKLIRRLCLILILSIVMSVCSGCGETLEQTEPTTELPIEYSTQLLTKIDHTWQEDESISSYEVLAGEQKILLDVTASQFVQDEEDPDSFFATGFQIDLYEWDIKSSTMSKIDLGGYTPYDVAWDGRTVVFIDEAHTLYQAVVENGKLDHVSQVTTNAGTAVFQCLDLSGNSLLFFSNSLELCVGSLENGRLANVAPLEGMDAGVGYSNAVLVGENPRVFVGLSSLTSYDTTQIDMKYWFLGEKPIPAEVDGLIDTGTYSGYLPQRSTNVAEDKIYYLVNGSQVYEAPLSAFIQKAARPVTEEAEPDGQGTYSCDLYDTGSFSSENRNKTAEENKSGVYYEIFVRSFADSDADGIGDFNGITQKLDYLQDLGIDGIWLMPINASGSYHGYDVTDYLSLNSEYGTEDDFKNLLTEAHSRGIKVIMDFVINHTGRDHPWFQAALADENSEYRDYYRWVHKNDTGDFSIADRSDWDSRVWHKSGDFYYYAMFTPSMPDLNYNNPKVRQEIKDAAGKWLNMGVDGFRLDAAMHIYGANEFKQESDPTGSTLTWWNEFARYCESINPDVYLVGEAWHGDEVLEAYVQPFDTKFNFAFQEKLLECVSGQTAVTSGQSLSVYLQDILKTYETVDTNYLDGIFGSNHDQERIMSAVDNAAQAKQVAAVYLTLPGNPFIYYGEELGMLGKKPDEMIRTPFLWGEGSSYNTAWIEDPQNTATPTLEIQSGDPNSMYSFYQKMIALRKTNPALVRGTYEAVDLGNDRIMAYIRETDGQKLLVIHNFAQEPQSLSLTEYSAEKVIFSAAGTTEADHITINGNESLILQLGI